MASFNEAFRSARKSGKKVFTWNGKSYHTRLKGEAAPKTSTTKKRSKVPVPANKPTAPAEKPVQGPTMARPVQGPSMLKPDQGPVRATPRQGSVSRAGQPMRPPVDWDATKAAISSAWSAAFPSEQVGRSARAKVRASLAKKR